MAKPQEYYDNNERRDKTMTEEKLDEIKEKVAEAENILADLEQLDEMIGFLTSYGGDSDPRCRLQLKGIYYPDDCIVDPEGHPIEEERYEDKSGTLGTYVSQEIIKSLETCRKELTQRFEELEV